MVQERGMSQSIYTLPDWLVSDRWSRTERSIGRYIMIALSTFLSHRSNTHWRQFQTWVSGASEAHFHAKQQLLQKSSISEPVEGEKTWWWRWLPDHRVENARRQTCTNASRTETFRLVPIKRFSQKKDKKWAGGKKWNDAAWQMRQTVK